MANILIVEDESDIVVSLEEDLRRQGYATEVGPQGAMILGALVIVWALPNTLQYIDYLAEGVDRRLAEAKDMLRRPFSRPRLAAYTQAYANPILGLAIGVLLSLALLRALSVAPTEFLYFTF